MRTCEPEYTTVGPHTLGPLLKVSFGPDQGYIWAAAFFDPLAFMAAMRKP